MSLAYNCIDLCHNTTSLAKQVDFAKMKKNGVEYVIFRSIRKGLIVDQSFDIYYEAAKAAGLYVGAYLYSYATSTTYAQKEAKAFVSLMNGRTLDLPIFYDLEDRSQASTYGKTKINNFAAAFQSVVEAAGYKFGIYCDKDYYKSYINTSKFSDVPFWIASYSSTKPSISNTMVAWQYAGTTTGCGLPSSLKCDRNHWYDTSYATTSTTTSSTTDATSDDYTTKTYSTYGKIYNCNSLNIRKEPKSGATVVGWYSNGDIVKTTTAAYDNDGNITWVKTSKGWISYKYFSPAIGTVTVLANKLNIRSTPSSENSSNIVEVVTKGESFTVIEKVTNSSGTMWYHIASGNYCSSNTEFVKFKSK